MPSEKQNETLLPETAQDQQDEEIRELMEERRRLRGGAAQRTADTGGTAGAGVDGGSSGIGIGRSPR